MVYIVLMTYCIACLSILIFNLGYALKRYWKKKQLSMKMEQK